MVILQREFYTYMFNIFIIDCYKAQKNWRYVLKFHTMTLLSYLKDITKIIKKKSNVSNIINIYNKHCVKLKNFQHDMRCIHRSRLQANT